MSKLAAYRLTIALGLAVLAISLSIFVIAKRAQDNAHNAKRACAAALQVRDATRDIIVDAKRRDPHPESSDFYGKSIARLDRVECAK